MSTVYVIFWELSFLVPDNSDEFQLMTIARIDSFALLGQFYINIRSDDGVFLSHSLRASSLGGGGREGERGESLQQCLRNLNAAPNTPRGSLLS